MNDLTHPEEHSDKRARTKNYSLCRSSCSVCPYHQGLLKLLDHGVAIVPTLPAADSSEEGNG